MTSGQKRSDDMAAIGDGSQFETIIEAIPSAVFIYQGDKVLHANRHTESLTGYSKQELLGMPFWGFVHPDFQEMVQQRSRARLAGEDVPDRYDFKIVRKDGEVRWVNWRANVIELNGKVAVMGVGADITERIHNDERLKQHQHQQSVCNTLGLEALAGGGLDALFQDTVERIAETLGVEFCKILELQPSGKSLLLRAGVGWKQGLVGHAIVGTELESQAGYTLQSKHPVIVKDLRTETRFSGPPLLHDHGVISGISVIIGSTDRPWGVLGTHSKESRDFSKDDISFIQMLSNTLALAIERKQVEGSLRLSEMNFRNLADSDFNALVVHRDFHLLYANVAAQQIFEASGPEHMLGESVLDYVHPRFRNFARLSVKRVIKRNEAIPPVEIKAVTPSGKELDIEIASTPVHFDGSPAVLSIVHDITERKRAEALLKETQARHEQAQHTAHLGHWMLDLVSNELVWSDEIYRIFEIDPKQFGASYEAFLAAIHPQDRQAVDHAYTDSLKTRQAYSIEHRLLMQDGRIKWVFEQCESEFSEDGSPLRSTGTVQDITERKQAEALVYKLSNAVTHAGGSIIITNRAGVIEYVNPAFTKITGYDAEEAMGQTPRILNSGNQDAAFYERMWQTITCGEIWHGKVIDKRKDGSFFPAILTIAPIADDQGVITHFVGSHADISELEDMEAQFHQAQKMEAIGTLVGGIAHDFNNLLAGMTGNLYLAKLKVQAQPDVVQKLSNIEHLSFRAAEMIQQLLTFARKDRVSMKALPFTPFIKETLKFFETSVPENVCMRQDICDEDLLLNGDGTQLHQVLMNLINNARDAVEHVHDPRITTRLSAFHADDGWLERHADFAPGCYAHLTGVSPFSHELLCKHLK